MADEHGEQDETPALIKALPPATDYMTYLTILEFNLEKEQLPLLHDILQDSQLTINIGWDLVHLLLPHLPESEQCLHDVACLGNPREVILKVTELLEELGIQVNAADEDEDEDEDDDREEEEEEEEEEDEEEKAEEDNSTAKRFTRARKYEKFCDQFQALVHMLCVLHPRIRTKYPSRFLITSLQALLPAYATLARFASATRSVLMLLKALSGSKRPHLPPRGTTEESIPTVKATSAAADPEDTGAPDVSEAETQKRLLRALVTHVAKHCLEHFSEVGGSSGLAWVERYGERREPEKVVPHRQSFSELFGDDEELQNRDALAGQMLNIAVGDLMITWPDLISSILSSPTSPSSPLSTPEFPLSPHGALYILGAKAATALLGSTLPPFALPLFPSHSLLVSTFVGDAAMANIGTEPLPLIDAVLTLGWSSFTAAHMTIDPLAVTSETFNKYLQRLSLLSANHPSPSLRYQAHVYTSTVLHSHPKSQVRLEFIKDTLAHCPYENLKASAVGWAKAEFLSAFDEHGNRYEESGDVASKEGSPTSNVFTAPGTLGVLAGLMCQGPGEMGAQEDLAGMAPVYLAVLNLVYLLCAGSERFAGLEVGRVLREGGVEGRFLGSLEAVVAGVRRDEGEGEQTEMVMGAELGLLEDGIAKAREALGKVVKA